MIAVAVVFALILLNGIIAGRGGVLTPVGTETPIASGSPAISPSAAPPESPAISPSAAPSAAPSESAAPSAAPSAPGSASPAPS